MVEFMARSYDIREFGAVGDGLTDCTVALQTAIDLCAESGGGTVLVAEGTYLFYPVRLRSHVRLEVAVNTVLIAGDNAEKYPEIAPNPVWRVEYALRKNRRYVIYAEGAEDVTICGEGTIDFNGAGFIKRDDSIPELGAAHWVRKDDQKVPGKCLWFAGCRNVRLENLTLLNAPGWFTWFLRCENVKVRGVTIYCDLRMPNSDGIHIGSCHDVIVSDCNIHTGDDCIVVRSMQEQFERPIFCENITVTNCILQSSTMAIRIGWTRDYQVRNCVFSNLVVKKSRRGICLTCPAFRDIRQYDPPRYPDTPKPYPDDQPYAIENLTFSNIEMETLYESLGIFLADSENVDYVRNISINNLRTHSGLFPAIVASDHHHVSNISFNHVELFIKPAGFDGAYIIRDGEKIPSRYSPASLRPGASGSSSNGILINCAEEVIFNDLRIRRLTEES